MINFTKELPQNTTVIQSEVLIQNVRSSIKKCSKVDPKMR